MRNKSLISLATKIGIPLIAPQSDGRDWNTPGAPGFDTKRNNAELDYFDNIIQDITKRFNIDRNKLLLSGFSSGGMTVWHLACNRGKSFAAFVPFSGTYWHPVPESCPTGPVHLFHTHGTKDSVVPLGGRPIGTTHQGNVKVAIERMASLGQYFSTDIKNPNGLNCSRQKNDQNKILELCLFSGGHSMKVSQIERVWYEIGLN